jgi:hypothetical protein
MGEGEPGCQHQGAVRAARHDFTPTREATGILRVTAKVAPRFCCKTPRCDTFPRGIPGRGAMPQYPDKRPQSVRPELFFYGPKLAAQLLFQEPRN